MGSCSLARRLSEESPRGRSERQGARDAVEVGYNTHASLQAAESKPGVCRCASCASAIKSYQGKTCHYPGRSPRIVDADFASPDPQWDWKYNWAHWELALRDTERVGLHTKHLEISLRDFTFTNPKHVCLSGDVVCLVL